MPLCYIPGVFFEMCVKSNAFDIHKVGLLSKDTLIKFITAFTFIFPAVLSFLFTAKGFGSEQSVSIPFYITVVSCAFQISVIWVLFYFLKDFI